MLIVPPHRKPVNSGTDDQEIHTRTHLGNIIQCGDYVLGFDVAHAVVNNQVFDKIKQVPRGGLFCFNLFSQFSMVLLWANLLLIFSPLMKFLIALARCHKDVEK